MANRVETKWMRRNVAIACAGPVMRTVRGWTNEGVPGLAVTRDYHGGGYCVTHLSSGCAMGGKVFSSAKHAAKAARALAKVADFTLPAPALGTPDKVAAMTAVWNPLLTRMGYYTGAARPLSVVVESWQKMAGEAAAARALFPEGL